MGQYHWDETIQAKKCRSLGNYTNEIEAAIAVAEALKDSLEIERLNKQLLQQRANDIEQRPLA